MSITFVVSAILTLLAGIGIFLIACSMMSSNLEAVSSSKLRALFAKMSGSKWLGVGIGAVATAAIVITGILGNVLSPYLCRLFRIRNEVAQGVALGTASHVIGTARATEIGQLCGAVSGVSLTLAGLLTAVFYSFLVQTL